MQFWKTGTDNNETCISAGNKGFGPDFGNVQITAAYLLCIKGN